MSSFHIAAKNGNLEILQTLLMAKDVDINSQVQKLSIKSVIL